MNIVQSSNRDTVRTQVSFLNNALGRKAFVQPRSKNVNGLWSPAFKGGLIQCPPTLAARIKKGLPPRSKAKKVFVVGVDLLSAKDHSVSTLPSVKGQRKYGTMANCFDNINFNTL